VAAFEDVSKVYGQVRAVDGVSLEIRAGETVALLEPNGAGKSTSVDMLPALRTPTSAQIRVLDGAALALARRLRDEASLRSLRYAKEAMNLAFTAARETDLYANINAMMACHQSQTPTRSGPRITAKLKNFAEAADAG
jgi:ABC-type branched-subunit amino acid transport system ATPase component